jgi:hypothetical protein
MEPRTLPSDEESSNDNSMNPNIVLIGDRVFGMLSSSLLCNRQ